MPHVPQKAAKPPVEVEEETVGAVGAVMLVTLLLLVLGFSGSTYACTSALYLPACLSLMCLFAVRALA